MPGSAGSKPASAELLISTCFKVRSDPQWAVAEQIICNTLSVWINDSLFWASHLSMKEDATCVKWVSTFIQFFHRRCMQAWTWWGSSLVHFSRQTWPKLAEVEGRATGETERSSSTAAPTHRTTEKRGKSRRTWNRTCEICWAGRGLRDLKTVRSWRWVESLTYHIPIELVSHPSFEKKTLFLSSCHPIVLHLTLLVVAMVPSSACLFCRSSEQILSWHNSHYRKTR